MFTSFNSRRLDTMIFNEKKITDITRYLLYLEDRLEYCMPRFRTSALYNIRLLAEGRVRYNNDPYPARLHHMRRYNLHIPKSQHLHQLQKHQPRL